MTRNQWWKTTSAFVATLGLLQPTALLAAGTTTADVTVGPRSSALVASRVVDASAEPNLTQAQKIALLRQKIKYVFVLFQENRSFDQHFGTFPGAHGLFPVGNQPGETQKIADVTVTNGNTKTTTVSTISAFKIPNSVVNTAGATVQLYPADTDSVDHSHTGIVNDIDYTNGVTLNDRYALNAEGLTTDANGNVVSRSTGAPLSSLTVTLAQKQTAELVMSHLDCDTVPFLWQYADRFALFDNFHMTVTGPSTPNAIAMIAGQSGLTQWAEHPSESAKNVAGTSLASSGGQPVTADPGPFAGSNLDYSAVKPPYGPNDESPATPALNQTYASLPLSFMGSKINTVIQSDENPALDLADVQSDIATIAAKDVAVNWGWYQEGYDHEPTDKPGTTTYATYITHHNAPQYFGYLGDNTKVQSTNLFGLADFYDTINAGKLPAGGGVFYVRGGYGNNDGLVPLDPTKSIQSAFAGSDDHPGYSDTQIAEALLADSVNAIAKSKYWSQSAIIISYDETDGLYDHVPASIRVDDSFGNPLSGGPRIPTIVISPYASVHSIVHGYTEHSSIIKFIDELFKLVPLQSLPNEAKAEHAAATTIEPNMGPVDNEGYIGDMLGAFDNARLSGTAAPLPASYAEIPDDVVHTLPHYNGQGCYTLNIVPTDYVGGKLLDPAPADFNPRPSSAPGLPTSPTWVP
jgi:phospholipase C